MHLAMHAHRYHLDCDARLRNLHNIYAARLFRNFLRDIIGLYPRENTGGFVNGMSVVNSL